MVLENGAAESPANRVRAPARFQDDFYRRPLRAHPVLVNGEKDRELVAKMNVEGAGGIAGLARDPVRVGAVIAGRIENLRGGLDQRPPGFNGLPMPFWFGPS